MIKWDGFGKLLKLSFFGLLTSFFTLFVGSFASATVIEVSNFQTIGLTSVPSKLDSQYDLNILKGGGFLTNYLGYGRNIFALDSNKLFFWLPNGYPYLYLNGSQGYLNTVSACDSMLSGGEYVTPSNCSSFDIWGGAGPTIFKNFFTTLKAGDLVYYSYSSNDNAYWYNQFKLCFSSEELIKSICFDYLTNYNHVLENPLSGSISLPSDTTFLNLPNKYLGPSPGQNGYMNNYEGSSQGSSEVNINNSITGDYVYQVCSNGYVKNYLEGQGLSKYACYVGLDINNSGLQIATAGTGSSVFELFQATNGGNNFSDWFTYWDTQYGNRLVLSSGAWSSNVGLYPYFQFVNEYAGQFTSSEIQDYCRIVVNDLSLTGKWTGNFKYCSSLSSSLGGPAGGSSSSWGDNPGDVPVGVNWGSGTENVDTITFIQNWFNKAKEVIPTDFSDLGGGVLPTYIIMFLIALMLFRFVSH